MPARPKTVEFGDYTIKGHLGEGGMCHVFRARKKGESVDCALKLLKEDQRKDPRVLDFFITEADLSMMLRHPNLIKTQDAGEVQGRYYIAMELVLGATLGELVAHCSRLGIPIPPDFALFLISEVLDGLHGVHTASAMSGRPLNLVHRDVTPHNIFIGFDGRVILGDFGITQITAYGDTEVGGAIGKIGYLSPEALSAEEVDRRADVFAMGIILFELLTRSRLYDEGTDEQIIEAIVEARVPRPKKLSPSISRPLENEMLKALARKPKDRFQTAEEMLYALQPFWSQLIGNPRALGAFMSGLYRDQARQWREEQKARNSSSSRRKPKPI